MSYHPRIETAQYASFVTTRSRNSQLWFVNNRQLEEVILGYVAKFIKRYNVLLYALAIEGNHIQCIADFPHSNRSSFMRDLNSCVARAVQRHCPTYPGGRFWARRYSSELVPGDHDREERFFYTVLQPVQDGLVEKVSQYPMYNCFNDAIKGIKRKFTVVDWSKYHDAKRWNPQVSIEDFIEVVYLEYQRLPGYEDMDSRQYQAHMHAKLNERQDVIVAKRIKEGKGFLGIEGLKSIVPGARPYQSKTSHRLSHRPRVLSISNERRAVVRAWYFSMYFAYKEASKKYRAGAIGVKFPVGMYPPHLPSIKAEIVV